MTQRSEAAEDLAFNTQNHHPMAEHTVRRAVGRLHEERGSFTVGESPEWSHWFGDETPLGLTMIP